MGQVIAVRFRLGIIPSPNKFLFRLEQSQSVTQTTKCRPCTKSALLCHKKIWDVELAKLAHQVSQWRAEYAEALRPEIEQTCQLFSA